jgi:hypothetical protein
MTVVFKAEKATEAGELASSLEAFRFLTDGIELSGPY